jgi:hypothetical protein
MSLKRQIPTENYGNLIIAHCTLYIAHFRPQGEKPSTPPCAVEKLGKIQGFKTSAIKPKLSGKIALLFSLKLTLYSCNKKILK